MKEPGEIQAEIDNIRLFEPKAVRGAREQTAVDLPAITPLDFVSLAGKSPPPRRFIVDQWVPAGCVTSLYGPGGVGKSMLAQQIATCVATGRSIFETAVEPGPVLGLLAEDDNDELWRRQVRINEWLGVGMSDLPRLHIQGRAGLENTIAHYPAGQPPTVMRLLDAIRQAAMRLKPALIVLDNIAQLFGGNENDRFQVSHFANLVGGLAVEFSCGLLLLGHPGKAEGSEYSGSTAWNAAVRSRLLLQSGKEDSGKLIFSRPKSNYARPDQMELQWSSGILRAADPKFMTYADKLEAGMREGRCNQVFVDALRKLTAQGRNLSHSSRAPNYAPKVIVQAALNDEFNAKEIADAMERLLNEGRIKAAQPLWKGGDRKPVCGLKEVGSDV